MLLVQKILIKLKSINAIHNHSCFDGLLIKIFLFFEKKNIKRLKKKPGIHISIGEKTDKGKIIKDKNIKEYLSIILE